MRSLIFRTSTGRVGAAFLAQRVFRKILLFPGHPLTLVDVPEPLIPTPHHVRVKTRMSGICGTDLRIVGVNLSPKSAAIAFSSQKTKSPMFLGHEVIGEVTSVGQEVRRVEVGQRVSLADEVSCAILPGEVCGYCRDGMPILCSKRNRGPVDQQLGGGWSECFVRHENQLVPVPDEISDDAGVLLEPLACSMHSVLRVPPRNGDKILVLGGGVIGLGVVAAIRALELTNVTIVVSVRHPYQGAAASALGANYVVSGGDLYEKLADIVDTKVMGKGKNRILHDGFHRVYDCVASETTVNQSLRWLRSRGSLALIGMNMVPGEVDFTPIWQREIGILGIHGYAQDNWGGIEMHTMDRCKEWIMDGRLSIDGLLTHRFSIEAYRDAIRTSTSHHSSDSAKAEREKAIKVAFDFRGH